MPKNRTNSLKWIFLCAISAYLWVLFYTWFDLADEFCHQVAGCYWLYGDKRLIEWENLLAAATAIYVLRKTIEHENNAYQQRDKTFWHRKIFAFNSNLEYSRRIHTAINKFLSEDPINLGALSEYLIMLQDQIGQFDKESTDFLSITGNKIVAENLINGCVRAINHIAPLATPSEPKEKAIEIIRRGVSGIGMVLEIAEDCTKTALAELQK